MLRRLVFALIPMLAAGVCLAAGPAGGPANMASNDLMVLAAGRGAGAAGSFWTTDLWIRCQAGGDATLEFHSLDSPSASPTATATVHMTQPVVYLADVMENLFGIDSGFGNLRVRTTNPASATIRVHSLGAGGSYGFAFMAMPASMGMGSAMMAGDREPYRMYVQGLLPQPQARVNLMVMNTSAFPIQGTVEVLDADGSAPAGGPIELRFSIQPYSGHQFNDMLASVRSRFSDDMGLQLRIRMDDGASGSMMSLAAVTDNATNDAYVVMGSMMISGQMPTMMGAMVEGAGR